MSPQSTGQQTRPARWWHRWPMVLWLTAIWVLLWGHLTLANVLAGLVVAVVLIKIAPMPAVGFHGRVSLGGLIILTGRFAFDVVHASFQVAGQALHFGKEPRGAVIRVRLRSESDLILTMTAEMCSLVPGSIIVEAHRLTGTLYVHILDVKQAGGIDAAKQAVLDQEKRLIYAFETPEDIEAAGLPPRTLWGTGSRKEAVA